MKNFDWKLWIIYLCIAASVVLLLNSCHTTRHVTKTKTHVDSTAITHMVIKHFSSADSATNTTEETHYKKQTDITLVPVELDSNEVAPPGVLVIKNKVTGRQKILVPKMTVFDSGDITKALNIEIHKSDSGTVNEQKNVKVISDKKQVQKEKETTGIPWWVYLLLIAGVIVYFSLGRIVK